MGVSAGMSSSTAPARSISSRTICSAFRSARSPNGKNVYNPPESLRINPARKQVTCGDRSLAEGESITLDSNTGRVFAGAVEVVIERPTAWLAEIAKWQRSSRY
jgi:hypothetical protein